MSTGEKSPFVDYRGREVHRPTQRMRELVEAHFKSIEVALICPICRNEQWDFAGIAANQVLLIDPEREATIYVTTATPTTIPMVIMVCAKCFYSAEFPARMLGVL